MADYERKLILKDRHDLLGGSWYLVKSDDAAYESTVNELGPLKYGAVDWWVFNIWANSVAWVNLPYVNMKSQIEFGPVSGDNYNWVQAEAFAVTTRPDRPYNYANLSVVGLQSLGSIYEDRRDAPFSTAEHWLLGVLAKSRYWPFLYGMAFKVSGYYGVSGQCDFVQLLSNELIGPEELA